MKQKKMKDTKGAPRVIKDGRVKIRPTLLHRSGLPIRPYDWSDKLPELLLIISLLERRSALECIELLRRFADALPKELLPKNGFSAGVTEFGELLQQSREGREAVIDPIVQEVFVESTRSIHRMFDLPGKAVLDAILKEPGPATKEDLLRVMAAVGTAMHGKSGRALRAKLVQLSLMDPRGARLKLDYCELNPILTAKSDDISKFVGRSQIQATWGGVKGMLDGERQTAWARHFWERGIETPCVMPSTRTRRDRIALGKRDKALVGKIDRLWGRIAQRMPLHRALFVGDVLIALTSRVWRFMHHVLETSSAGNGELAEISARCQWETLVNLEWLIRQDDINLFHRFRAYSAGRAKVSLERVRSDRDSYGGEEASREMESILMEEVHEGAGLWEQLVAEEAGGWSPKATKGMADDISGGVEYDVHFRRLSDIVHGLWRDLERYHVVRCANPLHRGHCLAWTGPTHDAGMTPVYYGMWLAVRALKALLNYMGDAAEKSWFARLTAIQNETTELMTEHNKRLFGHSCQ